MKPNLNLKSRYEQLDCDYLDKLNEKEKEWLNNFLEEEVNADFRHPGKKFNKTKKDKRRIYGKNNARNRDIVTRAHASHRLVYFSELNEDVGTNYELDKVIFKIDEEKKLKKKLNRNK